MRITKSHVTTAFINVTAELVGDVVVQGHYGRTFNPTRMRVEYVWDDGTWKEHQVYVTGLDSGGFNNSAGWRLHDGLDTLPDWAADLVVELAPKAAI